MTEPNERCNTCKFFYGLSGDRGLCQRFPPIVDTNKLFNRPTTYEFWWCGEWKPIKDSKP